MMALSSTSQRRVSGAVILPLRDGLSSFISLYDALLRVNHSSLNLIGSEGIRQLIVRAEQDLRRASDEAEGGLRQLDQDTEKLTAQQHTSSREREEKIQSLNNLKTKLHGKKESLATSEEALKQAKKHLQEEKDELKKQRDRKKTAEVVTGVGLAVTLIPIVGWVAGPVMAIGGAIDMAQAEKAIRAAEEEVEEAESQVEKYSDKVSNYESKITQIKQDIRRADKDLRHIRERLSEIQDQRWALAQFQEKMREAVHQLGRLSGSAHALELQTRRSILLEPVMKLLEEMVKAAGEVTGHQVLRDQRVLSLVEKVRDRHKRLTALCASHNNPALQNFI